MKSMDLHTGLYVKHDFARLLAAEVAKANEQEVPYVVLAVVPRHLPENGLEEVVRAAAGCVRDSLREGDIAGHLDDDVLAVGLFDSDHLSASVLAYRLQGDLQLRSSLLRSTVWETGFAVLPEDGTTAEELIATAVDAARNRRRQLASQPRRDAFTIPYALGEFAPR